MALATPTRRALSDLPVNTLGTPSSTNNIGKETLCNKRPIEKVADPEYAQPVSRVRMSPPSQTALPVDFPRAKVRVPQTAQSNVSAKAATQVQSRESAQTITPTPQITARMPTEPIVLDLMAEIEEVEEEDSQNSYNSTTDFDQDDTMVSQQTAATELTQPPPSRASQHVETLRLRLRLAHFKIRTNQIHIPLSQLRISTSHSPTAHAKTPEDEQPSLPKLLPAPILRPTAFSARTIPQPDIPSSPPCSPPELSPDKNIFRTPALPRQRHVSSPPDSLDQSPRTRYLDEKERLTSSTVRGNAAIGLLGLRQER